MIAALARGLVAVALASAAARVALPPAPLLRAGCAALGAAALWAVLFALDVLAGAGWAATAAAGLLAAWLWRAPASAERVATLDPAPRWLHACVAVAAIAAAAACGEHALRNPDGGWDAWLIWTSRARLLASPDAQAALGERLARLPAGAHGDYPLLLPGLVADLFALAGTRDGAVPLGVALLFGAACAAVAASAASALAGRTAGALVALALLSTPLLPTEIAGHVADVPLAAMLVAAAACVLLAHRAGWPASTVRLAGLFAGAAAWTKNEGLVVLLALGVALARDVVRDRPRALLDFALGAAAPLAVLLLFKIGFAPPGDMASGARFAALLSPAQWLLVLALVARRVVMFQEWGVALVAAFALAFAARRKRTPAERAAARPLPLALALTGLGYLAAYVVTPHDVRWHVASSANRLLLQLWPTALLALAVAWGPLTRRDAAPSP